MPRIANDTGVRRAGRLPWVLLSAPSKGCDHQVTARVSTPTATAAASAVHAELDGQPPGARDRLGPGQPVGAGLELAGDQRRAPEHADDHRRHGDDDDAGVEEVAVVRREVVEDVPVGRGEVGQPWTGRGQDQREGDREGRDGRGLGAELAPGEPDHRQDLHHRTGRDGSAAFHVGEHQVLESEAAHRPRRVEDGCVGADDEGALPVGVARRDDVLVGRQRGRVAARAGEPQVAVEQRLDVALDPDLGVDEHDEVVADPLQVGDDVRGEHDAQLVLGHRLHEDLQELPPGQRVEAGHRLVEDQQLRPLGQAEGEGELGALAAGQLAGALGRVEAEPVDPGPGHRVVPARVEVRAQPQVVGDAEARRRSGCPARRSRPWPAGPRRRRGGRRRPRWCRSSGAAWPTARLSSVVLPAPLGPTSPVTCPAGISSVQSASAQRRRYRLPRPSVRRTAVTLCPAARPETCSRTAPRCSPRRDPASRALASQRRSSRRSGSCAASESSVSDRVTNVPTPAGRRPARRAPARGRP